MTMGHAVFDLDGTLIDSVPVMADVLNAMLADRGAPIRLTHPDVRPHATAGGVAMIAALMGEYRGDLSRTVGEFRERYAAGPTPPDSLYPGVREGLARLARRGITLAICSNKPQNLCEKVVRDLDLAPMFGAVVGTGPDVPLKPDVTGLDRALALTRGARARGVFVGDSAVDHELASRANMPFILVTYGYGDPALADRIANRADHFDEAPAVIERLLERRAGPVAGGTMG